MTEQPIYKATNVDIPTGSDANTDDPSHALSPEDLESATLCVIAAMGSGINSMLVLFLSSKLLPHDSVVWHGICVVTWSFSFVVWSQITAQAVEYETWRRWKLHVPYAYFYLVACAISLGVACAELKTFGAEAMFDSGLFPLKELHWTFTVFMLLGVLWIILLSAFRANEKVGVTADDTEGASMKHGGC